MTRLIDLPTFAEQAVVHVVIESPRGSKLKLKYDPEQDVMTLSRPLPEGLAYPHDWGFIPSTLGPDGDPVDVMVMWDESAYPGVVMRCRPIGVVQVEQTSRTTHARERNDRVIVLPVSAARWHSISSVFQFDERVRTELERFFLAAVAFEGKDLRILGWSGPADALALVTASQQRPVNA